MVIAKTSQFDGHRPSLTVHGEILWLKMQKKKGAKRPQQNVSTTIHTATAGCLSLRRYSVPSTAAIDADLPRASTSLRKQLAVLASSFAPTELRLPDAFPHPAA